ncbi:MAG: hypothetical protein HYR51_15295 [Candidatus Rokubacteria bacterium]|nr:hypothetical protein [Candidatus Rokubacteria bacterium]
MKRGLTAGLIVLSLAGCATPTTWTKPGVTAGGQAQDVRECDREANRIARAEGKPGHQQWSTHGARQASPSGGLEPARRAEHEEKVSACMTLKGYEKPS